MWIPTFVKKKLFSLNGLKHGSQTQMFAGASHLRKAAWMPDNKDVQGLQPTPSSQPREIATRYQEEIQAQCCQILQYVKRSWKSGFLCAHFWFLKILHRPNKIQASSLLCLLLKLILELHMQPHNILELRNSVQKIPEKKFSLLWRECANNGNPQDGFSKGLTQQTRWSSGHCFTISRICSNVPWWLQIFLPTLHLMSQSSSLAIHYTCTFHVDIFFFHCKIEDNISQLSI